MLSIPPKLAVSDVVVTIKGHVTIRLLKHVPEIRKKYWGRRFWSRGYFVSTIGLPPAPPTFGWDPVHAQVPFRQ